MDKVSSACTLEDRERMLLSYLAGTMPEDKAEAFERHCMTCDECAAELERGVEVRAASTAPRCATGVVTSGRAPTPGPETRKFEWRWLAAAASVVLVVSVWRLTPQAPVPTPEEARVTPAVTAGSTVETPTPAMRVPSPQLPRPSAGSGKSGDNTLRSASQPMNPVPTREADGSIRIAWRALPSATQYVVTVHTADGKQILKQETSATTFTIAASQIARSVHERVIGRVEARSALGTVLSTSDPFVLPIR